MFIDIDTEVFLKGTYRDQSIEDVAAEDLPYLQGLLAGELLVADERELVQSHVDVWSRAA